MENIEEIKQKAYDIAYSFEMKYGCCSQCVLVAVKDTVGGEKIGGNAFRLATGLGAGLGGAGYACGALTGGILALGAFVGRDIEDLEDAAGIRFKTFRLARKLVERFEAEYGTDGADCRAIHTKLFGRHFDIVSGERDAFLAAGGHGAAGCPAVCGKAATWTIEILDEAGLL